MDQLNLERLHIPTVTVVTTPFAQLANTVATSEGVSSPCIVAVPHPIGMLAEPDVRHKAECAFPFIMEALTQWRPGPASANVQSVYPSEVIEFKGSVEEINHYFWTRKWSLGLPIVPPGIEFVETMLKGTKRKPDEILGLVPPRMGTLTVELAAVHAVMAGCRPEYMPVLIAALEGFMTPKANWRGALSTTGTTQSIVMVNGPVAGRVGIASEQGAAGKGHHANGAIGYAINLIAFIVGGVKTPLYRQVNSWLTRRLYLLGVCRK